MHLDPSKIPGYVKGQPPDRELFRKISFMDELEAMWGRKWGAQSKVGKLRYALVSPPSDNEESEEILEDPVCLTVSARTSRKCGSNTTVS
jgi:hypothetical protein